MVLTYTPPLSTGLGAAPPDKKNMISYLNLLRLSVDDHTTGIAAAGIHSLFSIGGTANAMTASLPPRAGGETRGTLILAIPVVTNTGPVTLQLDGATPRAIVRLDGSDLAAGEFAAGQIYTMRKWSDRGPWRIIAGGLSNSDFVNLDTELRGMITEGLGGAAEATSAVASTILPLYPHPGYLNNSAPMTASSDFTTATFVLGALVPETAIMTKLNIVAGAAGMFKLKIFKTETVPAGLHFTLVQDIALTTTVGLNSYDLTIPMKPGYGIGLHTGSAKLQYRGVKDPVGAWSSKEDVGNVETNNYINTKGRLKNVQLQVSAELSYASGDTIEAALPAPMSIWRAARAEALLGLRPARILCVGDSNTMGWSNDGVGVHRRARSYPASLARLLADLMPATSSNIFGRAIIANSVSQYRSYDPRVTFGTGWSIGGAVSLGGEMFKSETAGSTLTFAPGTIWDRAEAWVVVTAAAMLELTSGSVTQSYTPEVGQVVKLDLSLPTASVSDIVVRVISGTVNLIGVNVWSSASPGICVLNAGRSGWRAQDYAVATDTWSPLNAIPETNPDLVLIELGLNDVNQSVPIATFTASLRDLVAAGQAAGADVALIVPFPANKSGWNNYAEAIRGLAADLELPLFDTTTRMGTYAKAVTDGFAADALHLTATGLADKALMIRREL